MLELLDYRRRVAEMYHAVREMGTDAAGAQAHFRHERNELFRTHPQSPLDEQQKATFQELRYFDYAPAFRVVARVDTDVEPIRYELDLGEDGRVTLQQFGQVSFQLPTGSGTLGLFWIAGYGGGLFCPFGMRLAERRPTAVGDISMTRSKGQIWAQRLANWFWTLTMPITHRVTTIRDGSAHWHRHRIGWIFLSLLER